MSQSLVINGVDVEQETDGAKLRQLLDDCVGDAERSRIEMRLKTLGMSGMGEPRCGSKTTSLSSLKSSSQDVTESRVMESGDVVCGTPEFGSKTSIQSQ
jgi:hypothetical protein